ncbi:hypothetical protein [Butyrivibrio sp. LC3010]|uniref:hypothetical protein n=1 Tax=Butyrivibrio sp. LC3010 TaxID=1280680 RepID=UPI000412318A|nr:hypothetical protein [Butyrivibrio sp. LC3010]
MLKYKDFFILGILDKVNLANVEQLTLLAGFRDSSVMRKRLNKLIEEGYIYSGWIGAHKAYALTMKGLSELERTRKPYEMRGIKSEHEELVTEAACWIYARSDRSIMEMLFDHEINSLSEFKNTGHRPDIVYTSHQCLEVEISSKATSSYGGKSRLEENFKSNIKNYGRQTWIIPDHKKGLNKRLLQLAEKYNVTRYCRVMTIEEMKQEISLFNRMLNSPRMEPVRGIPLPRTRKIMEVRLDD